jgi:hypothetical protein
MNSAAQNSAGLVMISFHFVDFAIGAQLAIALERNRIAGSS